MRRARERESRGKSEGQDERGVVCVRGNEEAEQGSEDKEGKEKHKKKYRI